MRIRSAFTLIEVTTAIIITGVVALLAYGSVQAGLDTSDRVERYRAEVESSALMRIVVADALRHPASSSAIGAASFSISRGGAGGLNDDRLQFVSRGVSPPHGAGTLWNVVLEPGAGGLRLSAYPLEATSELAMESLIPAIGGMQVRVMSAGRDASWRNEWDSPNLVPRAVEIRFFDRAKREIGVPLLVVTAMEADDAGA
ncbi:MAG: prepilin-type N-terminal cleavage/methylation domain-containing protein [Gemmatimonadaceae bacterium]